MYFKRKYKVKPRGLTLAEFYAEESIVRVRYKDDDDIEWIAIADCKTIRQAQRVISRDTNQQFMRRPRTLAANEIPK